MNRLRMGMGALMLSLLPTGCDDAGGPGPETTERCASYDDSHGSFAIDPGDSSVRLTSAAVVADDTSAACGFAEGYLIDLSAKFGRYDHTFQLMYRPDDVLYVFEVDVDAERALETGDVFAIDGDDVEAAYKELEGDPLQRWVATEGQIEVVSVTDDWVQVRFEGAFEPDDGIGQAEGTFSATLEMEGPFDPDYGRPD